MVRYVYLRAISAAPGQQAETVFQASSPLAETAAELARQVSPTVVDPVFAHLEPELSQ